jgi:hypothetical protein
VLESRAANTAYLKTTGIEELVASAFPQIPLRGGSSDTRTNATMNSEGNYDPREQVITGPKERTWIDVSS